MKIDASPIQATVHSEGAGDTPLANPRAAGLPPAKVFLLLSCPSALSLSSMLQ